MKKYSLLFMIFPLLLLIFIIITQANSEILISLPDNYNYFRAPMTESGDPLNVTFSFKIRHSRIANVDMDKQTIEIYMSFKLKWSDERINFTEDSINENQVKFFSIKYLFTNYVAIYFAKIHSTKSKSYILF